LQAFSVDDANLSFKYLAMKPGECLVFSKRTLHTSDPRPHLRGDKISRLAMSVRVIVRAPGQSRIGFNPTHSYCTQNGHGLHRQLAKKAIHLENGTVQLDVGRHEMLFFDGSGLGIRHNQDRADASQPARRSGVREAKVEGSISAASEDGVEAEALRLAEQIEDLQGRRDGATNDAARKLYEGLLEKKEKLMEALTEKLL